MVSDSELCAMADVIFAQLCEREGGFNYDEIFMHLEYTVGQTAEDIKHRLDDIDAATVGKFPL